jgi:hypothetical protein
MKNLIAAVLLLGCGSVQAATQYFSSESNFLAATSITNFDGFESYAPTTATVTSISTDYFTVTTNPLDGGVAHLGIYGGNPTEGVQVLGVGSTTNDSYRLDFDFHEPISSVGFDLIDASERRTASNEQSFITVSVPGGEAFIISSCPPCLPDDTVQFFGLVFDSEISSFSITNTAWSDGIQLDPSHLIVVGKGFMT